ncbi:MAG TPA: amino acid permease, partial [Longimicrobiaceae bacterium]|nr:amino acid permease [Longimicrobiaceae bacterium]
MSPSATTPTPSPIGSSPDPASGPNALRRHISFRSATALVIANIIGAGIFTTTGFQAADLGHPVYIFALWIVGGGLALVGALCYAELGAMMPRAGGEYVYLRETYGAAAGFMSAFISLVAGFSAPIASATKSFVFYLGHFFPALAGEEPVAAGIAAVDLTALVIVWGLVLIHARAVRIGVGFIDWMTVFKVAGIVAIILAAAVMGRGDLSNFTEVAPWYPEMSAPTVLAAFGTSLIFVMFAFAGWNAAAYVAGEMDDPQRDLPRALISGTCLVLVLYLGLNAVYFYGASVTELAGQVEVGLVASRNLFGGWGVAMVTLVLCISILASASAMTMAGPRVYYALGRDFSVFSFLSRTRADGAPALALLVQGVVTS